MLVAGGAGLWSLRMSGLMGMLFASRPLWKDMDPIALLPEPEASEPRSAISPGAPQDGDAEAEMAAAELFDGVGHRGDNA